MIIENDRKAKYQGRQLLFLLLAMLLPAATLYLSFVLAIAAGQIRSAAPAHFGLSTVSTVTLLLYVPVQLAAARYMQRLFTPRPSAAAKWLQYFAALATGAIFSFCAAMVLVALGVNVITRLNR